MAKIKRSVSIEAPVARVFAYLNQPENFLAIWPSMVEVTNTKQLPNGGHSFDLVYKMAGIKFHGHAEVVEFVEHKLIVSRSEGGIPSTFRWSYDGTNGRTDLTLEVEYTVPMPVLGKLTEPIIGKINEHEAETLLKNLKATMEGSKV